MTSTRNNDDAVLNKADATNIGIIKINAMESCVPHYTPSTPQQAILSMQILSKVTTELEYVEKSVFMKEVNTENLWKFELGNRKGIKIHMCIIVGFQRRERQDNQILEYDTFYRPPVTSPHCIIGTEKYPDSAVL